MNDNHKLSSATVNENKTCINYLKYLCTLVYHFNLH